MDPKVLILLELWKMSKDGLFKVSEAVRIVKERLNIKTEEEAINWINNHQDMWDAEDPPF